MSWLISHMLIGLVLFLFFWMKNVCYCMLIILYVSSSNLYCTFVFITQWLTVWRYRFIIDQCFGYVLYVLQNNYLKTLFINLYKIPIRVRIFIFSKWYCWVYYSIIHFHFYQSDFKIRQVLSVAVSFPWKAKLTWQGHVGRCEQWDQYD